MWAYTPRQVAGFVELAVDRQRAERLAAFVDSFYAAQASGKAIKDHMNALQKGGG